MDRNFSWSIREDVCSITINLMHYFTMFIQLMKPPFYLILRVLVYNYFNGVYMQNGKSGGRPIYREMRKSDHTPFQGRIGAEIRYCAQEKAWVFTHPNITKVLPSKHRPEENDECRWLLRSPESPESYDLLDVSGEWSIWVGVINHGAQLSVTCNECMSSTDCNLNGVCLQNKTCDCYNEDVSFSRCGRASCLILISLSLLPPNSTMACTVSWRNHVQELPVRLQAAFPQFLFSFFDC